MIPSGPPSSDSLMIPWLLSLVLLRVVIGSFSHVLHYIFSFPVTIKYKTWQRCFICPILSYLWISSNFLGPTRAAQEWITERLSCSSRNMNISKSKVSQITIYDLEAVVQHIVSLFSIKAQGLRLFSSIIWDLIL